MRKSAVWLTIIVATISSFLVTTQAVALEVGKIQVRSYLNEPLVATIPVQVANIQERNSLATTLASDTEYVARGLQPVGSSDDLVIQVVEGRALEEMLIELRSLSSVDEPFLNVVLQLIWDGGSMVKEFTVLLDPAPIQAITDEAADDMAPVGLAPVLSLDNEASISDEDPALRMLAQDLANEPGVQVTGGEPQVVIRKISPDDYLAGKTDSATATTAYPSAYAVGDSYSPAPADAMQPSSAGSLSGNSYGPVAAGETLWSIATQARPSTSVSMAKVMEAIFQANPSAFAGSYETLKKGAVLTIPSAATMRATTGATTATTSTSADSRSDSNGDSVSARPAVATESSSDDETAPNIWGAPARDAQVDKKQLESKGGLITKSAKAPEAVAKAAEQSTSAEPEASAEASDAATPTEAAANGMPADNAAEGEDAKVATDKIAGQVDYSEAPALSGGTVGSSSSVETSEVADPTALAELPTTQASPVEADADGSAVADETEVAPPAVKPADEASSDEGEGQSNTTLLAAIILLVLFITYWWYRRQRKADPVASEAVYAETFNEEDIEVAPAEAEYANDVTDKYETEESSAAASIDEQSQQAPDPSGSALEQANTYLSYGLYESAAETLNQGIAEDSQNAELRMKLLETCEASGSSEQFIAAVEDWKANGPAIEDANREQITAMGQRLAPGASLFGAAAVIEASAASGDAAVDIDAPAEESVETEELPLPDFDLDTQPTSTEADSVALNLDNDDFASTAVTEGEISEDLELPELDLDIADLSNEASESTPSAAASGQDDQSAMDFELDDEPAATTDTPDVKEQADHESINFELDDLDLEDSSPALTEDITTDATDSPADVPSFSLDESDLELELEDEPAESAAAEEQATPDESEYAVKIDLAQAYLDMGEPDLAKGLLEEVTSGGNAEQKASAQALLDQLD